MLRLSGGTQGPLRQLAVNGAHGVCWTSRVLTCIATTAVATISPTEGTFPFRNKLRLLQEGRFQQTFSWAWGAVRAAVALPSGVDLTRRSGLVIAGVSAPLPPSTHGAQLRRSAADARDLPDPNASDTFRQPSHAGPFDADTGDEPRTPDTVRTAAEDPANRGADPAHPVRVHREYLPLTHGGTACHHVLRPNRDHGSHRE